MADPVQALVVDLLEWIGPAGRPYAEVMEAWRTSCPRLPVWEEANGQGFVDVTHEPGQPALVVLTPRGREHVSRARARASA
jgi:D-3-phosphoglycerate dehydrogenase